MARARAWLGVGACLVGLWLASCGREGRGTTLTVSAAANLASVMARVGPAFEAQTGARMLINVGATGSLAHQIQAGAPVDVLLAADTATIERLVASGALRADTVTHYARGRLVAWSRDALGDPAPRTLADLDRPLVRRVALANPDLAPYGALARSALQKAGVWPALEARVVYLDNVRQALQVAQSGNAEVAIVPLSLVVGAEGTWFPLADDLGSTLEQHAAVASRASSPELGRRFLAFLAGPEGRAILTEAGFEVPAAPHGGVAP